ncbi:restriction endonuclease [Streptomyces malaysiensis]|uniref:restriction endonuclease n=1 Tax=Streptomyces malaysiensis TaxID=92644 RepID=UPI000C99DBC9|nr:restriction endonuclease [Streptomyces malaysiensis]
MAILLIADDVNSRGDLFNERMKDLVHALGYEVVRTNIHKPGREIDIIAKHPLEGHRAVVECKAHKEKIGGGDVNKFVGALDAERGPQEQVAGYFASISGFKDSALEQEEATGRNRVALLGPNQIVEQLVKNRVIAPKSTATFRAGTLTGKAKEWHVDDECDVVAHSSGWLWAVYFTINGVRQAFTLVHADGDFPAELIAAEVVEGMCNEGVTMPYRSGRPAPQASDVESARTAYYAHLLQEYGNFTLEGFPVDQYVGSKNISLEDLYIPQTLEDITENEPPTDSEEGERYSRKNRINLSEVLSGNKAIAILGVPGAGKTTLIKRLATGYADRGRLALVHDSLPKTDWVPLVLRCRDIQDAGRTIVEILRDIPSHMEMPQHTQSFEPLIDASLRSGQALVLIDGLDEFPDAANRARFLQRLRTFMSTYPLCTIIITSREAGFREVSGFVSERFRRYRISDLTNGEIRSLTVAWHVQAYGKSQQTIGRATALAEQIIIKDRVRRLAVNPLLLTTLLLVQRWVGDLPRKRSVLYEKAIELLLMTWNVEGFRPIDLDEAKPHLAFLAYSMTASGKQQICKDEMLEIFAEARLALPEVLGFCKLRPHDLLGRIELRSSLVTQVGHEIYNGVLQPTYEFKHLTFQEYLTATAMVSGWHPDAIEGYDPLVGLDSALSDPRWHEIISLFGVLSGRKGSAVVGLILEQAGAAIDDYMNAPIEGDDAEMEMVRNLTELLYTCLEDEVQVSPDVADQALDVLIEWHWMSDSDETDDYLGLATSRYGNLLLDKARAWILDPTEPYDSAYVGLLGQVFLADLVQEEGGPEKIGEVIQVKLASGDLVDVAAALKAIMVLAYRLSQHVISEAEHGIQEADAFRICRDSFGQVLSTIQNPNPAIKYTALWAAAWLASSFRPSKKQQITLLPILRGLLLGPPQGGINAFAGWVISDALVNLGAFPVLQFGKYEKGRLQEHLVVSEDEWLHHAARGAIVLAALSGDVELQEQALQALRAHKESYPKLHRRVVTYMRKHGKLVSSPPDALE